MNPLLPQHSHYLNEPFLRKLILTSLDYLFKGMWRKYSNLCLDALSSTKFGRNVASKMLVPDNTPPRNATNNAATLVGFKRAVDQALSLYPTAQECSEKEIRTSLKNKFLNSLQDLRDKVLEAVYKQESWVPLFPVETGDNFTSDGSKLFRRLYFPDFETFGLIGVLGDGPDKRGTYFGVLILPHFNAEQMAQSDPTTWGSVAS